MTWSLIIPKEKFHTWCRELSNTVVKMADIGFEVRYIPKRLLEELQACPKDFKDLDPSCTLDDMHQVWFQGVPKGWEALATTENVESQ